MYHVHEVIRPTAPVETKASQVRHGARDLASSSKEWLRILSYLAIAAADSVAILVAFVSANYVYMGTFENNHGGIMAAVLLPLYLLFSALNGGYNGHTLESVRASMQSAVQSFLIAAAVVLFIAYYLKAGGSFSRVVFTMGTVGSLILLPALRSVLHSPIKRSLGGSPYRRIIIFDGLTVPQADPSDIVLHAEDLGFDPFNTSPLSYHALASLVATADRVIVACSHDRSLAWSSVLKGIAVDGEIVDEAEDKLGIIGVGRYGSARTHIVAAGPLRIRDRVLKRALDLALSLSATILLSPVLLAVALAIRLESKGPVLFIQDRIGRDNRLFRMYKFRSMFTDQCDADAISLTSRGDARVTRIGALIRRTSIDELPQLFNVIKGDMSIVGPRPHAISAKADNVLYWDVDPRYRHRHAMKPGMTGLAQIRGFRGPTDHKEDLTNRLTADLEYSANWSLWRDLWIILQTLKVLRHDNAF